MLNYKDILNAITENDVIKIMQRLGSDVRGGGTTSGGVTYLQFKTICHGGDSDKLYYYTDSKSFYCYTSCGFMGFYDCIQHILGIDEHNFYAAVEYVAEAISYQDPDEQFKVVTKPDESIEMYRQFMQARKHNYQYIYNPEIPIDKEDIFYNKDILTHFDHDTFPKEWIDEGISTDIMRKFGICWNWYDCSVIIPHYCKTGELMGIRRRSFYEDELNCGRKYTPLNSLEGYFPHELGRNLYGIYENVYASPEKMELIHGRTYDYSAVLFEGEKSVLKMVSYFGEDSLLVPFASCGFNITQIQIKLLKDMGFRKVYICLDKDFDVRKRLTTYKHDEVTRFNYIRYLEKIDKIYKMASLAFQNGVRIVMDAYGDSVLGEKDSPIDKGPEIFMDLLAKAEKYRIDSDELNRFKGSL